MHGIKRSRRIRAT